MKLRKLNKSWHERHRMPPRAALAQPIRWHLEHRKHCSCRPIPGRLAETTKAGGLL